MKIRHLALGIVCILTAAFVGCGPPEIPPLVEIDTNETAFLVPLEGASKTDQAMFMSVDYLDEAKVAAKRVVLPVRKRKIGRGWWAYEWIPTMRVIKVDRTPVTREWTMGAGTGTSKQNQAIEVESKDSIGFAVGVNLTVSVPEEQASTFLYYYAGKPLDQVVDENVRGFVQSVLGREFGMRDLKQCKSDKAEIFETAFKESQEHFLTRGIVIDNLGHSEGLTYEDKEIQEAINKAYTAEMAVQQAQFEKERQAELNDMNVTKAEADRRAAEEFAKAQDAMVARLQLDIAKVRADAELKRAEQWDGHLPANMMPNSGNFLFGLDTGSSPVPSIQAAGK